MSTSVLADFPALSQYFHWTAVLPARPPQFFRPARGLPLPPQATAARTKLARFRLSLGSGLQLRTSTSHLSSHGSISPDWPGVVALQPQTKSTHRHATWTQLQWASGSGPAPCRLAARAGWSGERGMLGGSDSWQDAVFASEAGAAAALPRREIVVGAPVLALSAVAFSANAEPALVASSKPGSAGQVPRKVFVAGATGNTGKRIVRALLERGIKVRAGVRSLEKAEQTFGAATPDLEFVQVNVEEGVATLQAALGDADVAVCATGFSPGLDPTAAWKVDNLGTVALVDACLAQGITRFVLISSILTNGAAWGQGLNPNYLILNLFGLVLIAKLQAERYIQRSGINYTIVRPGGLRNDPPSGNIIMGAEDTLSSGSISRDLVAEVAVEALFLPEASYKIVEIVDSPDAPKKSLKELFAGLP